MTRQGNLVKIQWVDLIKFGFTLLIVLSPVYVTMQVSMARQDERIKNLENQIALMRVDMKDLTTFIIQDREK